MALERLPAQSTVDPSDSVPIYSQSLGADVRVPVSALAGAISASITSADGVAVQRSAPTTGATVAVAASPVTAETMLMLTPAGTLAALTVQLPAAVNSTDGQRVRVFSTQTLTALALASTGATFIGTTTTLAANTSVLYRYDGVLSAWVRL